MGKEGKNGPQNVEHHSDLLANIGIDTTCKKKLLFQNERRRHDELNKEYSPKNGIKRVDSSESASFNAFDLRVNVCNC